MFVSVDGRKQWVEIAGEGMPAIVLESGCGGTSTDWAAIQRVLSRETTVLAYDRAWSGDSEPSSRERLASTMAGELHALLEAAALDPPFILVGLSLGALITREYARRYRDEVCAMLLIEPAHEDLELEMPPDYWRHEQAQLDAAAAANRQGKPGFAAELESLAATTREMREEADHDLGDLPLTVITAKMKWGDVPTEIDREAVDRAWVALHERTARLSSTGRRVEAPRSGHNVHVDDPELVIRETLALLSRCRGEAGGGFHLFA